MLTRLRILASRIRGVLSRRREEPAFDDELREHLELLTADNIRRGLAPAHARRDARLRLGGALQLRETHRELTGLPALETLAQDVRFALRLLRRSPAFTSVAVLTLALGIGASTAVFSLVDAVLLKPLPFPHSERVVFPWRLPKQGLNLGFDTYPWGRVDFLFFSRASKAFDALGAFQSESFDLTGSGEPVRVDGLRASAGFFPSLAVSPELGRTFTDDEDRPGNEHEVVLSDALWRERFGADRDVLGRAIQMDGSAYTVIGVMPPGFAFPRANEMPDVFTFAPQVQVWVPLALNRASMIPNEPDELAIVGRLKAGVREAEAQADMDAMGQELERGRRNGQGWFRSRVTPLARQAAGQAREPLVLILAAVAVLLLISCSNVASLLLARALNRTSELSLRAALGASASRLLRQWLTESLVLASLGGAGGVLAAEAALHVVKTFAPAGIPRLHDASLDVRVLLFALGVTLLTGVLFGTAPALGAARDHLVDRLTDGHRRTHSTAGTRRARNALLVVQIALALVLVIATGLLTRTFSRLLQVDPGFRAANALTFELTLPASKYPDQAHLVPTYQDVLRHLQALPGVEAAGVTEIVPLGGATESTAVRFSDHVSTSTLDIPMANYTMVSPGYFAAAGTPILRGRAFLDSDSATAMPVAIVSAALAGTYWPGQDPIGKPIAPRSLTFPLATVVGVAADVKRISLRESPPPEMYVPYTQKVWPPLQTMDVVLRTREDPASMAASVRAAVHAVNPDLPVAGMRTLADVVSDSVAPPRFAMLTLAAFGVLSLLLAAAGMFGVMSYSVAQRTQEIGILIALGAQRRRVLRLVLAQGGRLAGAGVAIGIVAAAAVTRVMSTFLYGVGAADPLTFAAVAVLLMVVALAACYLPARRAMNVDPTVALRYE